MLEVSLLYVQSLYWKGFHSGSAGKESDLPALGWEDPLEKGTATHSSILAWRIPWTMCSQWGRKESDTTERLSLSLFYIRTFKYVLLKR